MQLECAGARCDGMTELIGGALPRIASESTIQE